MTTSQISRTSNQVEQPLLIHAASVAGSAALADAVTRPIATGTPGTSDWFLAIADPDAALAENRDASELAADMVQQALPAGGSLDPANGLRSAYGELNTYFLACVPASRQASLVTAVTNGKYVTIANIGSTGAFLVRANRLNRITPMPADETPSSGAQKRGQGATVLGESEKLDPRQPAIFEIVLLPEDILVLCGGDACEVIAQLQTSQLEQMTSLVDTGLPVVLPVLGSTRGALAALAVEPARELVVSAPVSGERSWILPIAAMLLLAVLAVVVALLLI